MITGELKSKIDNIWETFWTDGLANPLSVIEQVTYLLFIKLLDDNQIKHQNILSSIDQELSQLKSALEIEKWQGEFEKQTLKDCYLTELKIIEGKLECYKDF